MDTLILGCTHYPIISELIGDVVGEEVTLVNPAVETARQTERILMKNDLLGDESLPGHTEYFVSDDPESFSEVASIFLQEQVSAEVNLVDVDSL